MNTVIADRLSKTYAQTNKALDQVSFSLGKGEVFGFLGPNGAGKTTMVKLLNGMLEPTEGSCLVCGIDPAVHPEKMHRIAGVVTEHAQMYDHLTGYENLVFYGTLFGIGGSESQTRAQILLKRLGLNDAKDKKLAAYSTGMRQRLSLARAMIHRPEVLFLDEPTSGLDPESAQSVNQMIKQLAKEDGTTVFLCTHQLRYAQEICSSYGLIDEGVLLAQGTIEQLRAMVFSGMTVTIRADDIPAEILSHRTGVNEYEISVASEEDIPPVIRQIVDQGGNIYRVTAKRMSLEEIYFALIEERKGGGRR